MSHQFYWKGLSLKICLKLVKFQPRSKLHYYFVINYLLENFITKRYIALFEIYCKFVVNFE